MIIEVEHWPAKREVQVGPVGKVGVGIMKRANWHEERLRWEDSNIAVYYIPDALTIQEAGVLIDNLEIARLIAGYLDFQPDVFRFEVDRYQQPGRWFIAKVGLVEDEDDS